MGSIVAAATASGEIPDQHAIMSLFQSGTTNVVVLIGTYLALLGTFGLLAEIILSVSWWKLLARGTTIINPQALRSVRAGPEDTVADRRRPRRRPQCGGLLMEFYARYQDGKVADATRGDLRRRSRRPAGLRRHPRSATRHEDARSARRRRRWPSSSGARELRLGAVGQIEGARLVVSKIDIRRARSLAPSLEQHHRRNAFRQFNLRRIGRTVALVSVIVAYIFGVPLLANRLIVIVPRNGSREVARQTRSRAKIRPRSPRGQRLRRLRSQSVTRLANQAIRASSPSFRWPRLALHPEVTVVRSPSPTPSRCRAGGPTISRRSLAASQTPEEFAGVLAHELGHVYYRHSMETLIATSATGLPRRLRARRHDRPLGRRRHRLGADRQSLLARS